MIAPAHGASSGATWVWPAASGPCGIGCWERLRRNAGGKDSPTPRGAVGFFHPLFLDLDPQARVEVANRGPSAFGARDYCPFGLSCYSGSSVSTALFWLWNRFCNG